MKKYVFVTGGVSSSLGKGVAAASLGSLLETRGLEVRIIKIDPYINVDAGTMSPYQHGEVYVTDDGAETDLDLGNYARFTSAPISRENSITTGQVYQEVIKGEREGRYLGRTVQVIPHITDEIKRRITVVGERDEVDVTIIEVGGTVGDIESIPFLEAARQFVHDIGRRNVVYIHVTLAPTVGNGELKTKPTQHSTKELREIGIQPDILLCRAARPLTNDEQRKIALFTNVDEEAVISAYDVSTTIYEIPLVFHGQKLDELVVQKLGIECPPADLTRWERVIDTVANAKEVVRIALVGKYLDLLDAYKSVNEALSHGGIANQARIEIVKVDSDNIDGKGDLAEKLKGIDGMLIPGGFGARGIDGMVTAAKYARVNGMPCFGICLGMQVMVIEYARSVLGLLEANSTEFVPNNPDPVISLLEEQIDITNYGGTMRLGRCETVLTEGTKIREVYCESVIAERHRHRYEVSNRYRNLLAERGLIVGGVTADDALVESVQWSDHPWGIGVQFHPEFKSKPFAPHPLFASFIKASMRNA